MVQCLRRAALLAVTCTLVLPAAARAGDTVLTWTVTSAADTVSAGPADGICDAGGGAGCTLREAAKEASARPGGDVFNEIELPAGRIDLGSTLAFSHGGTTLNVDITGRGAGVTTVSGQNASRVLTIGANARVELRDASLVQGAAPAGQGGGLVVLSGDSRFGAIGVVLADGDAAYGGAVSATGSSRLGLIDTLVQDNTAGPSDAGGAISFAGDSAVLERSAFVGNQAGYGGGVYVSGSGAQYVEVTDTTFADNTITGQGTALRMDQDSAGDVLDVRRSTFVGNASSLAGAGALNVAAFPGATTSLTGLVFQDNTGGNCFGLAEPTRLATESVSDDATCGFTDPSSLDATEPLLGALGVQGGEYGLPVALPEAGSPAIGRVTSCIGGTRDQRGLDRLGAGETTCDAGAAERIVGDLAVDGSTPSVTVGADESATVTVGLAHVAGRQAPDAYVRIDAVPGAEIVSVDHYERDDPTHLICTAAGGGYDCIVNGGLGDRREVALRVRRATPGAAQVRVVAASSFVEATPADNDLTVGPTVPVPAGPSGPAAPAGPGPGSPLPGGPPVQTSPSAAPAVSALIVRRNTRTRRYVASFRLSGPGRVQLTLERRVRKGPRIRYVKITTVVRPFGVGKRSITLPSKVKGRSLPRGTYRVSVRGVSVTGRAGTVKRTTFRLR